MSGPSSASAYGDSGWGYPAELLIDRRAAERRFADDADDHIARYADQAWHDTVVLRQLLLWHAQHHNAQVVVGETVDRIDVTGGRCTVATVQGRRFTTDIVVGGAGPDADAVARQAGAWLPLEKVPPWSRSRPRTRSPRTPS